MGGGIFGIYNTKLVLEALVRISFSSRSLCIFKKPFVASADHAKGLQRSAAPALDVRVCVGVQHRGVRETTGPEDRTGRLFGPPLLMITYSDVLTLIAPPLRFIA